jgi:hypothetical protein
MAKNKRGAISLEEEKFILDNIDHMSDDDIAKRIRRSPEFVQKYRLAPPNRKNAGKPSDPKAGPLRKLRQSHFWREIKHSLLVGEVNYFEQEWVRLIDQFSTNEILPTDELMIKDCIMLDVASNRALAEKKKTLEKILDFDRKLTLEEGRGDRQDPRRIASLSTQINALRAALPALSKEHLEYQDKKDRKLRDLKATRDLRYKNIEESKRNIFELIKELDTYEKRKREGRWMELMRMAADKVGDRWNQVIEYEDGSFDKPFLSPEGEMENEDVDFTPVPEENVELEPEVEKLKEGVHRDDDGEVYYTPVKGLEESDDE